MLGKTFGLAMAAVMLAGCSTISTPADQIAVKYNGGPIESRTFDSCIDPSQRNWSDMGDDYYLYPVNQRFYEFDSSKQTDDGSIEFVAADDIVMTVNGIVTFNLDTTCDVIREFHEKVGARSKAYFNSDGNSDGWDNMLDTQIGTPIQAAVRRAAQNYTYPELYGEPSTKAKWEADVLELLPELVNRQTEGDTEFFKNFGITLQIPQPPDSIKEALLEEQASVARQRAAKAEAEAQQLAAKAQIAVEKAESEKAEPWIALLGRQGYLDKLMIEEGLNPRQPASAIITK